MTTRRLAATVQHVLLFAVIAVLPSTAVAEPIRYSVGVKTWAADWGALNTNGEFRSYVGALFGPVAIARYRQVFVGATFFTGQLDFPFTQTVVNPPNITTTNTTIVAQRTDLDLTAGYYFLPTFGVIGGFKSVTFEFTFPPSPVPAKIPRGSSKRPRARSWGCSAAMLSGARASPCTAMPRTRSYNANSGEAAAAPARSAARPARSGSRIGFRRSR